MKRRPAEISLKDAIEKLLHDLNLSNKLKEVQLIGSWEKIAGKLIARHTQDIYIKNRILFIKTDTAALKQELTYMKTRLLEKLNKEAGEDVIEDIRFIG